MKEGSKMFDLRAETLLLNCYTFGSDFALIFNIED